MLLESRLENNILFVEITHSPVNCLSLTVRRDLYRTFTLDANDPHVGAIILSGAGKYFCAGGDLREMGTAVADAAPRLSADILPAIENCSKPVVAAIHGGAIGGGFEMALTCHYRLALQNARIVLPEITHGIIPLSGTIRLPRLWGVARALTMILTSSAKISADFSGGDVFDGIIPCDSLDPEGQRALLREAAVSFTREQVLSQDGAVHRQRLVRHRPPADADPRRALAEVLEHLQKSATTPAHESAITAVRAGIESADFDASLAESQRIYDALVAALPTRATVI